MLFGGALHPMDAEPHTHASHSGNKERKDFLMGTRCDWEAEATKSMLAQPFLMVPKHLFALEQNAPDAQESSTAKQISSRAEAWLGRVLTHK
jgi:hypothetical protein